MNFLRHHTLSKIFTYLTCLAFLNMNFFLVEVVLLDFNDKKLVQNIAGLIASSGFEEEKDCQSSGNDTADKGTGLPENHLLLHHSSLVLTGTKLIRLLIDHYPDNNYAQTFTPPPEHCPAVSI